MRRPFPILLTMCVCMVIGLALVGRLDISNEPRPRQGKTLYIHYNWHGASAKVIEQNVTSVIEGLVTSVKGVENVSSDSYFGWGRVIVELKKRVDVSGTKFEIASLLRQIRKKLPEGVSYPSLTGGEVQTGNKQNDKVKHILTYQINAGLNTLQIKELIETSVKPELERIEGVYRVDVTGGVGRYMEIAYNARRLANYGLAASDIEDAIRSFMGKEGVVGDVVEQQLDGNIIRIPLLLATEKFSRELEQMPIKTIDGKIIYLNDLAQYTYKDYEPGSYYRVNGMNTIYINIIAEADRNMLNVSKAVKECDALQGQIHGHDIYFTKTYDRAEEELTEFQTLVRRSALSLLLLLLFVWLSRREWKYLAIVTMTLLANILMAVIVYWLCDIRLHPFSLAGVTVSLGLIIDSSIVMVDHYSYYRNRKAFMGILAALLTTIASLVVVFWLPAHLKHELYDFSWTVIINLSVALLVAALFVPALTDSMHYESRQKGRPRRMQLTRGWNRIYSRYITAVGRRRWICIVLLVLAFGIPIHLLPDKIGEDKEVTEKWYTALYNSTLGSNFFQHSCKEPLSKVLGGSIRLFSESLHKVQSREEEEMKLNIRAQMPLGGTATDLNDKVQILEVFLSQFSEIERYETHINGGGAHIIVEFTEDAQHSGFPYTLENDVIGKVIKIGGADWSTYGVSERGFSNSLNLQYRSNSIEIAGYDYTRLYRYAEDICKILARNGRVMDVAIETPGHEHQEDELYMVYDQQALNRAGLDVSDIHGHLNSLLSERHLGRYEDRHLKTDLVLRSEEKDDFDLWQLENTFLKVRGSDVLVSDFMKIERREAKNCISKRNQEYVLRVAFNVLGSYTYTHKYIQSVIKETEDMLPVGFRTLERTYRWGGGEQAQYWLIGLIVVIIFFVCAILFESLRQAFAIVLLIPTSLIGIFLTYYLTGAPFGTGGFAAMVLLCGLSVNAGIYLINEYNHLHRTSSMVGTSTSYSLRLFVKAYNHKIVPILLTVLSTVVGLIPFLFDGASNPFWYSFAVGSMGGLLFSLIALVFALPVFVILNIEN